MAVGASVAGSTWSARRATGPRLPKPIQRFLKHKPAVVAAGIILLYLIGALIAPLVAQFDPLDMSAGPRLYPPNIVHWFGTDEFGRDIFTRVLFGARIAFTVGVSAALIASV